MPSGIPGAMVSGLCLPWGAMLTLKRSDGAKAGLMTVTVCGNGDLLRTVGLVNHIYGGNALFIACGRQIGSKHSLIDQRQRLCTASKRHVFDSSRVNAVSHIKPNFGKREVYA